MSIFGIITAFESVATAVEMKTMVNVVTISMINAWMFVPEGDVAPSCFDGSNNALSVYEAEIAPVSWAAM